MAGTSLETDVHVEQLFASTFVISTSRFEYSLIFTFLCILVHLIGFCSRLLYQSTDERTPQKLMCYLLCSHDLGMACKSRTVDRAEKHPVICIMLRLFAMLWIVGRQYLLSVLSSQLCQSSHMESSQHRGAKNLLSLAAS